MVVFVRGLRAERLLDCLHDAAPDLEAVEEGGDLHGARRDEERDRDLRGEEPDGEEAEGEVLQRQRARGDARAAAAVQEEEAHVERAEDGNYGGDGSDDHAGSEHV